MLRRAFREKLSDIKMGKSFPKHLVGFAGLAIGLTLTTIHIVGINVTGVSVNPAWSAGQPAVSCACGWNDVLHDQDSAPVCDGGRSQIVCSVGSTNVRPVS